MAYAFAYPAYCSAKQSAVVSLRHRSVDTRACISLGLENRQGHWLCWMSTGRKNGLLIRTYTRFSGSIVAYEYDNPTPRGACFALGERNVCVAGKKPTCSPSRHCRDAVRGSMVIHTTTAMHDIEEYVTTRYALRPGIVGMRCEGLGSEG